MSEGSQIKSSIMVENCTLRSTSSLTQASIFTIAYSSDEPLSSLRCFVSSISDLAEISSIVDDFFVSFILFDTIFVFRAHGRSLITGRKKFLCHQYSFNGTNKNQHFKNYTGKGFHTDYVWHSITLD